MNERAEIVQYNLAFILPQLSGVDHGRVLGYDNSHGIHERHFEGSVEVIAFTNYKKTAARFFREVEALRRTR